jgi:alkanesulfonate monooxygenase SsuD/methylene tetrahydromethanopterin reductase-like flavin-dependent oxidoreductase (luciferase family)
MTAGGVKVGLMLPLFSGDPAKVIGAAREADSLGYDGVFGFDHLFQMNATPETPSLEVFTMLAAAAAVTRRIAVGTLITRAALRPPGMAAKLASTVDLVSGGRMILGVGTGDRNGDLEHRVYGFPIREASERRAHLEEWIGAVTSLFRGEPFAGGDLVGPVEGPLVPASRPGGPPVWVGGAGDAMVRLAARSADGWNGWGLAPDAFRAKAALLADSASSRGSSPEATWAGTVLVGEDGADAERLMAARRERGAGEPDWWGPAEGLTDFLQSLRDAGASWAILLLAGPADRRRLVAERVLSP